LHFQKTGGLHFQMRNELLVEINFDAENCFNLRHHKIVTLLSGAGRLLTLHARLPREPR